MALVFTEEFEETIGAAPTGWTAEVGAGSISAGGYRGKCCFFTPPSTLRQGLPSTYSSFTLFFAASIHQNSNYTPFTLAQQVGTGTTPLNWSNLFSIGVAQDNSIYVVDAGGNMTCDGVAAFSYKAQNHFNFDWSFFQLDATLSNTTIGTASAIKLACNLHWNGESLAQGTSTFLSSLPAFVDTMRINGAGDQTSGIDSIYFYNSIVAGPIVTPNQGTNIDARVSQAVIEYLALPTNADARVSQAVIEYIALPSAGNARVSQAVIELILANRTGWRVYEA